MKGILAVLILLIPTFVYGQYNHNKFKDYGSTNSNNVVIIEKQEIQFEDTGIRVVGVAANLLGLDYYYRVQPNYNGAAQFTQPPLGYGVQTYQQFNQYGQPYTQPSCNQNQEYPNMQQYSNGQQQVVSNDVLEKVLKYAADRLITEISKECFGLKPGTTPSTPPGTQPQPTPKPNPTPNPNPTPSTNLDAEAFKIFSANCIGCHKAENPSKGLALVTKEGNLPTLTLYQYTEIIDRVTGGAGLTPAQIMPKDAPPLTDSEVETLRKWVREKKKTVK